MRKYEYKAFISYSHKDIVFAEKLQKSLESYYIPTKLRAINDNKKHFKIFRDVTDLTSGALQESLNTELENSEYLIVICSPNSAKNSSNKHWVNLEVQHFKDIGRENFIIPIIIDGEPLSHNERDCFCPALQRKTNGDEFLGINAISKDEKKSIKLKNKILNFIGIPSEEDIEERAIIHTVAKMLNVRFDDVWNRKQKKQRKALISKILFFSIILLLFGLIATKVIIIVILAILGILSIILGCAYGIWNSYWKVTVKYYQNYVDKWGIPEGIGELTKEEIKHLYQHFKFEYRAGKLIRVICENSVGTPMSPENFLNPFSIQELEYNKNKELVSIKSLDRYGNVLLKSEQRPDLEYCRVNLTDIYNPNYDEAQFMSFVSGENVNLRTREIKKEKNGSFSYERNKDGYITKIWFHNNHNEYLKTTDKYGTFEYRITLFPNGLLKTMIHFNRFEEQQADNTGVMAFKYDYDSNGRKIKHMTFFEASSTIEQYYYSATGNLIKMISEKESVEYDYDSHGFRISETYKKIDSNDIYKKIFEYNSQGEKICEYLLKNDKFVSDEYGFCKKFYEYNKYGDIIKCIYCNSEGKRINTEDGISFLTYKYDSHGNKIETRIFDKDELPVKLYGYHKMQRLYNLQNKPMEELVYDENNILINKVIRDYDERGNVVEYKTVDADNIPLQFYDGYIYKIKYDDLGNLCEIARFDADGNPYTSITDGHKQRFWYDTDGNLIKMAFYDEYGGYYTSPACNYAILKIDYNKWYHYYDEYKLDSNQNPVVIGDNIFRSRTFYNENNEVLFTELYNLDDKIIAKLEDNIIEFYNEDGEIIDKQKLSE